MGDPPKLVRPDTDHPPKREKNRHDVRRYELNPQYQLSRFVKENNSGKPYHLLRVYLPVALNVPKPHYAKDGRGSFDDAEVRILLEREGEVGVLTDSHKGRGCV